MNLRIALTILTLLVFGLPNSHFTQTQIQKDTRRIAKSDDFSLSVFEKYEWLNTNNRKSIINDYTNIYLLVYINELDADLDLTISYLNSLKAKNNSYKTLYIYNSSTLQTKELRHLKQLIYNKGIVDPIVLVNSKLLIENMNIEDYPIAFIYSNRYGSINYYEGFDELKNIEDDLIEVLDKLNIEKDPPIPKAPTANVSIPIVGQFGHIEAAENNAWLFVSCPAANRVIVLNESGDLIDIVGNGSSGNKDGFAINASFNNPNGMCWDRSTGILYIADTDNHSIRTVNYQDINKPVVKTLIDPAKSLSIGKSEETYPTDVELVGYKLLITMSGINEVWIYDLEKETITTNGVALSNKGADSTNVNFDRPISLTSSKKGGVFLWNSGSENLIEYDAKRDLLKAQDLEELDLPLGQILSDGGTLVATSPLMNKIITFKDGNIDEIIGDGLYGYRDGNKEESRFFNPYGIALLRNHYYITDIGNNSIRKIHSKSKKVSTLEIGDIDLMIEAKRSLEFEMEFTSPEIPTAEGKVLIEIELDLDDKYEIVPHTKNLVVNLEEGLKSGTQMTVEEGDLNNGRIKVSINGGELATYSRLLLNVVYRDKESPKNTYYKHINLMLIYGFDEYAKEKFNFKIPIN